jgi:hypothetical protein
VRQGERRREEGGEGERERTRRDQSGVVLNARMAAASKSPAIWAAPVRVELQW